MMRAMLLDWSGIVQRRVGPAMVKCEGIEVVDIASRFEEPADFGFPKYRKWYWGYREGLEQSDAELVYISLPNSMHAEWSEAALKSGRHVIVDKPSVTSLADAQRLAALARERGLCYAESSVWPFQPATEMMKAVLREKGSGPLCAQMVFTSPRPDPLPIYYSAELGGGALFDRGPYAVSCGRFLMDGQPVESQLRVMSRYEGLPVTCHVMLRYEDGSVLSAFLGIDGEYANELSVTRNGVKARMARLFTPPADYEPMIEVVAANKAETITAPASDTFANFIGAVVKKVETGDGPDFTDLLLRDAGVMDALR